jgi:DNA-binding transcriptional MocR family regulator
MLQLVPALDRLGTETAFEVLARAEALQRQGKSIVNLGIGQPDFKTPQHIVEAAVKALRDGHHGYTPAQGILPLREAVAKDLKRRHDVEVHPDTIVIWPGGKPTMFFSILMFGQPGAEIMYPDPGFPIYRSMIRAATTRQRRHTGARLQFMRRRLAGSTPWSASRFIIWPPLRLRSVIGQEQRDIGDAARPLLLLAHSVAPLTLGEPLPDNVGERRSN